MNDELRGCPFCSGYGEIEMDETGLYLVRCQVCDVQTPPEYRPDQAVAAWNAFWDEFLKPCPFCGGEATTTYDSRGLPCVMCRECGCRTAPSGKWPIQSGNLRYARDAWNRRVGDA